MSVTIIISRGENDDYSDELAGLCAGLGGVQVLLAPHLYHLPEESSLWAEWQALHGVVVFVAALHSRPAAWLLRRHGVVVEERQICNSNAFADAQACFSTIRDLLELPEGESPRAPGARTRGIHRAALVPGAG